MPKSNSKAQPKVTVNIKPAKLADVTPVQLAAGAKFWVRLISQVKSELQGESQDQTGKVT